MARLNEKRINTYQYGNTVRFECEFFDFENKPVEPELVRFVIYNGKYEEVLSIILSKNNEKEDGKYFYDYTTERISKRYYYEWYGEIEGKATLARAEFKTNFIN